MDGNDRTLVYLAKKDRDNASVERLSKHGWVILRAHDIGSVRKILKSNPTRAYAALVDFRSTFDIAELAGFEKALCAQNACWVAAVDSEIIKDESIQSLIRNYFYDYVHLPCPDNVIDTVIGHAHGMAMLACCATTATSPARFPTLDGIIGDCQAMQTLGRTLRKAAGTDAPVFIAGETGTGKELAAMALHQHSRRREKPFVAINCGAIPRDLVQSELFGYEKGAFTGAAARKLGRVEMANGGTLFLDEIGDLPLDSQATLLRFLQQGSIERVGGHEQIPIDVRVISATHHDLQAAIAQGRFRADLYHRLGVLHLQQPALRDRAADIDKLAHHALRLYSEETQRSIKGFAACARRALHAHSWPGNVRELINRVRQAVVMAEGKLITANDLHLDDTLMVKTQSLETVRAQAVKGAIEAALEINCGRIGDTARALQISRVTLYRLMTRHEIRVAEHPVESERSMPAD